MTITKRYGPKHSIRISNVDEAMVNLMRKRGWKWLIVSYGANWRSFELFSVLAYCSLLPFHFIFVPNMNFSFESKAIPCPIYCNTSERPLFSRLRLADILVRPTQRLTKYGLLLGAIRKHVVDENDAESLELMVCTVE